MHCFDFDSKMFIVGSYNRSNLSMISPKLTSLMIVTSIMMIHLSTFGSCLKLLSVHVPTMVVMGQPIWLNCSYDLEYEELYSIKWYHWNADSDAKGEFYRWIPKDFPPGQMFPMSGIHLDLSRSSFGNVYLSKSDIFTDGSFRCEVSAEAPSFRTVRKEKELHIYSLPKEKPIIRDANGNNETTTYSHYGPGDLINLTCRTKPSRPKSSITWYINDELAEPRYVKSDDNLEENFNGLQSSSSRLYFFAERNHFHNGMMKVSCVSDMVIQYSMASEEILIGDDLDHNHNQYHHHHHSQYKNSPQTVTDSISKEMPIITGLQQNRRYRPGDIVNLTCISRAKPAPKLSFLINDEEAAPAQLRRFPIFSLSDGSFASKLGLKFEIKAENSVFSSSKPTNRYHSTTNSLLKSNSGHSSSSSQWTSMAIKQYRIKCLAAMQKNIHSDYTEIHLGSSKQSSGLHFAENFAIDVKINATYWYLLCSMMTLVLTKSRIVLISN
ncbi:hypothetical protein SSS_03445 [Sarcoptes scabiei]|uniref:Ig-like domain-containing protein n=1 Tax=Sarcoptes scabiei TaxID=52283 RepID=A0A834VA12_SARSC|nr:hypothetical protein SSS_03445 [Sarcoptes scabiei]